MTAAGGDCFAVAANVIVDEMADDPSAVLVHGRPLGTGGEAKGLRYWHAWVERTYTVRHPNWPTPINYVEVVDRSNMVSKPSEWTTPIWPREMFYQLGRIEATVRYTREQAIKRMLGTGHYGPWEET
jgi:hypothetical protein